MVWISALLEASWTITPNPVTNSRASDSQSASDWPPRKRRTFRDRRLPKAGARGSSIDEVGGGPPMRVTRPFGSRALQLGTVARKRADALARPRVDRVA